jgi:hypothetical protein
MYTGGDRAMTTLRKYFKNWLTSTDNPLTSDYIHEDKGEVDKQMKDKGIVQKEDKGFSCQHKEFKGLCGKCTLWLIGKGKI